MLFLRLVVSSVAVVLQVYGQSSEIIADGATNPELIPDWVVYKAVLLSLSAEANGRDVDKERAAAFLNGVPITPNERAILAQKALTFRQSFRAITNQRMSMEMAKRFENVTTLAQDASLDINSGLTTNSLTKFQSYIEKQKRYIKLVPIPAMAPKASNSLLDRIMELFSMPIVHAQMSYTGSIYTIAQGGYTDNTPEGQTGAVLYAYGVTDAGGCGCHSDSSQLTVSLPNGQTVNASVTSTDYAEATTSISLQSLSPVMEILW